MHGVKGQGAKEAHLHMQSSHLKVLAASPMNNPPEATIVQSLNCSIVVASTFCAVVNPGHSAAEKPAPEPF